MTASHRIAGSGVGQASMDAGAINKSVEAGLEAAMTESRRHNSASGVEEKRQVTTKEPTDSIANGC